jgi:CRP/FNR family transcriptional regulator
MNVEAQEQIKDSFGFLFSDKLIQEIIEVGEIKKVKAGDLIIDLGDSLNYMPLLIEGAIKVLREDDEGDELLLYFIERGDTCAMTMTCCVGGTKSEIRACAEVDSTIVMVPVQKMSDWIETHRDWRTFVFESYNNRMTEMLESIDSLAFMNMHERIYKYLKDKVMVNKETSLNVTHQEIANDLHTSRVVVSRILKSLEKEGRIKLHRNKLELLDF